jgi:hypothetical protein
MRQFLRALVRAAYDEVWDPVMGRFNYYHVETELLYVDKPKLLRTEPWDPNRIPDWTIDRVSVKWKWVSYVLLCDVVLRFVVLQIRSSIVHSNHINQPFSP